MREPALEFIAAMAPHLAKFAPRFRAAPRKMGGSLMRVFRNTRFARDESPDKTNIGIRLRHKLGRDLHAPGPCMDTAGDECFFGAGSWHRDAGRLGRIRDPVAADPKRWFSARDDKMFAAHLTLAGENLSRGFHARA